MQSILELQERLKTVLPEYRYFHSLGVSYTAACLAMRYDAAIPDAELAGLLHDCAKYMGEAQMLDSCKSAGIAASQWEQDSPFLLHGKLGAYFAASKYGVVREEIKDAICYHTTGRPKMALLEQIVFVADYIEPGRENLSGLKEARQAAFTDLDEASCRIAYYTLLYLEQKKSIIDPMTKETFQYYNEKIGYLF